MDFVYEWIDEYAENQFVPNLSNLEVDEPIYISWAITVQ